MPLADNWKQILKRAWSVRLNALSAVATTVILAWPTALLDTWNALPDHMKTFMPKKILLIVPLALTLGAIYARTIVQKKLTPNV